MSKVNFSIFEDTVNDTNFLDFHSARTIDKNSKVLAEDFEKLFSQVNDVLIVGIRRMIVPENIRGPIVNFANETFLKFIFNHNAEIRKYLNENHSVFFVVQLFTDFKTEAKSSIYAFVDFGTEDQRRFFEESVWKNE